MHTTLIDVHTLNRRHQDPDWRVIDARFSLADAGQGAREYGEGHVPGALYAHLDDDLSGPIIRGETGRHPLPSVERAIEVFSRLGIDGSVQVAVYDGAGGSVAGRVWWMLRWLGHDAVAVVDGGWPAWTRAGLPVTQEVGEVAAAHLRAQRPATPGHRRRRCRPAPERPGLDRPGRPHAGTLPRRAGTHRSRGRPYPGRHMRVFRCEPEGRRMLSVAGGTETEI